MEISKKMDTKTVSRDSSNNKYLISFVKMFPVRKHWFNQPTMLEKWSD